MSRNSLNKSSSFYSEAYYEKARKEAFKKKPIYRQRNKQLYDQEHQLDILRYYRNRSGRCQMIRYYEMIAELFFVMREKNIKGSDQYNETVTEYVAKVNDKIKYFHQFLMCDDFETREERQQRAKEQHDPPNPPKEYETMEQCEQKVKEEKDQPNHMPPLQQHPPTPQTKEKDVPRRLDTCNQCPIFIQEYEVNFEKTTTLIAKQSSYWDKLNGNQKLAKFRRYIEQNLKILNFQLENKCEFARQNNRRPNRLRRFGRP